MLFQPNVYCTNVLGYEKMQSNLAMRLFYVLGTDSKAIDRMRKRGKKDVTLFPFTPGPGITCKAPGNCLTAYMFFCKRLS
jgi:hypothetical protein